MVHHVKADNFPKEVLEYQGVVVVDFYADWCGPCKVVTPIIDNLAQELKEVKFVKVDVDKSPELSSRYSVFSIPTFLIFKNGRVVSQLMGGQSKEGLREEINKIIK